MSLTTAIIVNAVLDVAIMGALFFVMSRPLRWKAAHPAVEPLAVYAERDVELAKAA